MCNGISHTPHIPQLPGRESFTGRVIHSSQVSDQVFSNASHIVVVGGDKSAYDCAEEAARRGIATTLRAHRKQWRVPRYRPEDEPSDYAFFGRELHQLLPFYADTPEQAAEKTALEPLRIQTFQDLSGPFSAVRQDTGHVRIPETGRRSSRLAGSRSRWWGYLRSGQRRPDHGPGSVTVVSESDPTRCERPGLQRPRIIVCLSVDRC
jgi:hypothetical protein